MEGADRASRSAAWSAAYLVASRISTLAAVPILLSSLGTDLYAVWVLASTLVFAQSLVDLGFSGTLVRFVATAAAEGSRRAVTIAIRRAAALYGVVSLLGVLIWVLARPIATALPYLDDRQLDDAVTLLHYMAVAFALTNVSIVMGGALQGLNRVATSYRAQTIGIVAFIPSLVAALAVAPAAEAAGIATLVSYAVQVVLLAPPLWLAIRRIGESEAPAPPLRAMVSIGAQWQVSHWADFATFQLPRIAAALALSSRAVVVIDLALRVGQAVAAPLYALFPLVVPRASTVFARRGLDGVRDVLRPALRIGTPLLLLGAAVAIPLTAPAIETWSSIDLSVGDSIAASVVVLGALAHASTGVLSSVLLAVGTIGPVVRYKMLQLALAVPVMAVGVLVAEGVGLGVALGLVLLGPACWFNRRAAATLAIVLPVARWHLLGGACLLVTVAALVIAIGPRAPAAVVTATAGLTGVLVAAALISRADPNLTRTVLGLRTRTRRGGAAA